MIGKRCLTHIFRHLKFHGVWTIILLTYSHTVYTAMNILNCPSIPTENGRKSVRMSYAITLHAIYYFIIQFSIGILMGLLSVSLVHTYH